MEWKIGRNQKGISSEVGQRPKINDGYFFITSMHIQDSPSMGTSPLMEKRRYLEAKI